MDDVLTPVQILYLILPLEVFFVIVVGHIVDVFYNFEIDIGVAP
jgi:hypothetical protein